MTWYGSAHAEDLKSETPSGNNINIRTDYNFVYGGGDELSAALATNNRLNIFGGTITGIFGGMAANGYSANNNYIVVNDGIITGVIGGVAVWQSGWSVGNVFGNTVEVNGGTVAYVSGGEVAKISLPNNPVSDTSSALANAFNNRVIIRGGAIQNIIGGAALSGDAYGNTIEISGGTISGEVVGGKTESGNAYNNTVTISGSPNLIDASLIGGKIGNNISYLGNVLNVNTWGITAKTIDGFETINFLLPNQISGTALTLTDSVNFGSGLENINISVRGDSNIGTGSRLNLIQSNVGINLGAKSLLATSGDAAHVYYNTLMSRGVTFNYDLALDLSADGRSLTGTVGSNRGPDSRTETTTKAQLANLVTVNNTTDNLMNNFNDTFGDHLDVDSDGYFSDRTSGDDGSGESDRAQKPEDIREQHGFEIFGSANFGHLRTKSGSGRVKTDSNNFDLGLARTYESGAGRWVVAPVVEYGKGNYDAFLSSGIKGYGDTKYTAGGFIARNMNNVGYYFEMSARFGRSKNDFASDDFLVNNQPTRATYHTSAPVFAGHIRIGQAKRLNRSNLLDVYAIYAYTRQGGSNTTLSTGEDYKFSSISSKRFRLGYRLTTRTSRISRIYTGLAWQHESTSDAVTRAIDAEGNFWQLPSSGAKGSSGMIELGWLIKPHQNNPWLVDINTTGWIGHQRGLTAMAKIKKSF